jgi:flagellar biosynthesis component FlhA
MMVILPLTSKDQESTLDAPDITGHSHRTFFAFSLCRTFNVQQQQQEQQQQEQQEQQQQQQQTNNNKQTNNTNKQTNKQTTPTNT